MQPSHPMTGIPASVFAQRRAAVLDRLGDGVLVLPAAAPIVRSRDTEASYRPDSELFWLCGATEPGTIAVLAGGEEASFQLFVADRDPEQEVWNGPRLGPEEASARFGADETWPASELDQRLPAILQSGSGIHVRLGRHSSVDRLVLAALQVARRRGPREGTGPRSVVDPGEVLDDLRLIKDAHEIERLRAAAALSVVAHRAAIGVMGPGVGEWEVEAAVNACFRRGGGAGPAYETIVGSAANACVLHYVANDRTLEAGDLLLLDAGAELALYAGDITRTYPVDGRFRDEQRAVYDVVEAARAAAVDRVRPGVAIADVHDEAVRVLTRGLVDLGVLAGDVDGLIEQSAYRSVYPHQTSHWIGLDVHDPGDYARDGVSQILAPGMVFSVEPGLYFRDAGEDGAAERFAGIGVRIEDDILVTEDGHENLTATLPTEAGALEALIAESR